MLTSLGRAWSAVVALIAVLCLVGCAPSIEAARVAQVHRVAIVSFENSAGPPAAVYYEALRAHLASTMHWEVLPENEVAASPAMTAVVRGSPGLLSFNQASLLDASERVSLIKGLRVDAIAVARLYFYGGSSTTAINGASLGRGGAQLRSGTSQAYSAGVQFSLFDGQGGIWSDLQAKGEETREGKPEEAAALQLTAVQNSYLALTGRYREAAR